MHWRTVLLGALLFLAALFFAADFVLTRVLSVQLPQLLSEISGKPVTLRALDVELFKLGARAQLLRIGETDPPALQLENVSLTVEGVALFLGEIRFRDVDAGFAAINLTAWQEEDDGAGLDRETLKRWLPERARVQTLTLYRDSALLSLTENTRWQRLDGGRQRLAWTQAGLLSELSVDVEFSPVFELLDEQRGQVHANIARVDQPDDFFTLDLTVAPTDEGIHQTLKVDTKAIAGAWTFVSDDLLTWPERSVLDLRTLDLDRVFLATEQVLGTSGLELNDWLQSPLPEIELPMHQVDLKVDEFTLEDGTLTGISAMVVTTPADDLS